MAEEGRVIISDEAFAYLAVQRGGIDHLKGDRVAWEEAYIASIAADFKSIEPYLPARCDWILDVGSGLGGIDIWLQRHYQGDAQLVLLDGQDDKPEVQRHASTFNHMGAAHRFLTANGASMATFLTPEAIARELYLLVDPTFDLVISLQAWCFHIPPAAYLPFVLKRLRRRHGVLILDVRKGKPEWEAQLAEAFEPVAIASEGRKSMRRVYAAR